MKLLSRDFTKGELVLIIFLVVALLALAYYQFIDIPVRTAIQNAESEADALNVELTAVNAKVAELKRMSEDLEKFKGGSTGILASYNNQKAELDYLNAVLGSNPNYSLNLPTNATEGSENLVRRNFTLSYTTNSFEDLSNLIRAVSGCPYRCYIGDLSFSINNNTYSGRTITMDMTGTFYETMVGGTKDAGLVPYKK
ncbi:MAG: hypothetical protein II794_00800 [Oscillospiraceae bacterium]|nr:hypothetical protein [Oscillospiraceae bacterium]